MAIWRLERTAGNRFLFPQKRLGQGDGLLGRKEPVGAQSDDEEFGCRMPERLGQASVFLGEVIRIHGFCNAQVGVGIEAFDELLPLVGEVAFNLKPEAAILDARLATELGLHNGRRQIGDMSDLPGMCKSPGRAMLLVVVVAASPMGVGFNGIAGDRVECQGLS